MIKIKHENLTLEAILADRGITNEWFQAGMHSFHKPALLKNADKAWDILKQNTHKHTVVVVDSDVDGVCSATITVQGLEKLGYTNIQLVKFEGKTHGIDGRVDKLPTDMEFLIIPDAGSNDVVECEALANRGVDILILDHHEIEVENKFAIVVNPHQEGCEYPNKGLCGTTVAWKIFSAIVDMYNMLDLCAMATVADKMTLLTLENIGFVRTGLDNICNPFLLSHFKMDSRLSTGNKDLDANLIGWYLAPLINGTIRAGSPEDVISIVEGMLGKCNSDELIDGLLKLRNKQNRNVDTSLPVIVMKTEDDANIIVAKRPPALKSSATGLVASKLTNHYGKPVLLGSLAEDGFFRGSARNIGGSAINFRDVLLDTGLMEFCSGHTNAFGFGIHQNNIPALKEAMSTINFGERVITIDGLLNTTNNMEELLLNVLDLVGWCECDIESINLGLKVDDTFNGFFTMKDKHCKAKWGKIDIVEFGTTEPFKEGELLIVKPSINEWNGVKSIQLMVKDRVRI